MSFLLWWIVNAAHPLKFPVQIPNLLDIWNIIKDRLVCDFYLLFHCMWLHVHVGWDGDWGWGQVFIGEN